MPTRLIFVGNTTEGKLFYNADANPTEKNAIFIDSQETETPVDLVSFISSNPDMNEIRSTPFHQFLWDGAEGQMADRWKRVFMNRTQPVDESLIKDVEVKKLEDPIRDRRFTVELKAGVAKVNLPTGDVQTQIINATDKNSAELDTMLLVACVTEIGDQPVLSPNRIRTLGITDRRLLLDEIAKRNPGPQLSEIKKACGTCGQEVYLPLTLAELFRQ
jgi:hypothetical protein